MSEPGRQTEDQNHTVMALSQLYSRWKDGTFSVIIDDWKWIFSYSRKYKGAIAFNTFLGVYGTTLGLVSSVASKYMIDIISAFYNFAAAFFVIWYYNEVMALPAFSTAPILLQDEATSALDVTTERQVLRNIMGNYPDKTCIVTTHRPSVLNMCKRVYRVMDTRITELDEAESSWMAMDF